MSKSVYIFFHARQILQFFETVFNKKEVEDNEKSDTYNKGDWGGIEAFNPPNDNTHVRYEHERFD
jgi:hypothetical protein